MQSEPLIIPERSRDIGGFTVGRLLPHRAKRMVGPFIYMDHMGPAKLGPEKYLDVDQHPHIGLSTLTYMMDGEILHQDSMGNVQPIQPGAVNWMVAGNGVTHTERTPGTMRNGKIISVHGYQIWIALPDGEEEIDPEFHHVPKEEIPAWKDDSASYRLIAGEAFGKSSPVPVRSRMFFVEVNASKDFVLYAANNLYGEIGICIVEGSISFNSKTVEKGNLVVAGEDILPALEVTAGSSLLLLGGDSYARERHIYWNFVSSSKEKIEKAKQRWEDNDFPKVPNDDTYVPLR